MTRGIEYRNVISTGQVLTLLAFAGGVAALIFTGGQRYSDVTSLQARERDERILVVQRERDDRMNSIAAEVAARLAAENLLRSETTAAIDRASAKLDTFTLLAAHDAKNTADALADMKESLKSLTAASKPTGR